MGGGVWGRVGRLVSWLVGRGAVWLPRLVGVDEEAGEGAVLVGVAPVHLAPVQLHVHLVPYIQVQDHAVGGIVVVLVGVLGDGTGPHLQ